MNRRKDEARWDEWDPALMARQQENDGPILTVLGIAMALLLAIIAIAASNGEVIAWLK